MTYFIYHKLTLKKIKNKDIDSKLHHTFGHTILPTLMLSFSKSPPYFIPNDSASICQVLMMRQRE